MRDREKEEETAEEERQNRELSKLSPIDRVHGGPPLVTQTGRLDDRSRKRKGKVVQFSLRLQLRVMAEISLVMERDKHPDRGVLVEEMLQAYFEKYGDIDRSRLASEDELANNYVKVQRKKDAK